MFHAALVVLLIGLADSLNPTTIGPAMFLATTSHPRRAIGTFLLGFLAVNFLGGLIIMLGPGELILHLVPKPRPTAKHVIEVVAGAGLLLIAVLLWAGRRGLGRRKPPTYKGSRRGGLALGAGIAAVELPTALPYLAAIAVIVGSGASLPGKVIGLVIFNAAFLAPVFAMLFALVVLGDGAREPLARINTWMVGHWPSLVAALAGLVGLSLLAFGVLGLARA